MKNFKARVVMALTFGAQGQAAAFVYVSNAGDADIGIQTIRG